jgi:hypothetical protein
MGLFAPNQAQNWLRSAQVPGLKWLCSSRTLGDLVAPDVDDATAKRRIQT